MENQDINQKKRMSVENAAELVSKAMNDFVERKISLRQAVTISRIAMTLAKVIEVAELNERVEFLEQSLKNRR